MEKKESSTEKGAIYEELEVPKRPPIDSDEIDELRKRLYTRGEEMRTVRHSIPPRTKPAPAPERPPVPPPPPVPSDTIEEMGRTSKRNAFRKKVAVWGLGFFVSALFISTIIMFWGGNIVSGENISLVAEGPTAVGGGEEYEFQVTVANGNSVPIQSATLIVSYPKGTHSATDPDAEVTLERHALETIGTNGVVNVPLKVRMYGEENEEKEIQLWLEYRVSGSNATFEKHASPLRFTITTSPVIVRFETMNSAASGKEVEVGLVIESNSTAPFENLLVKAYYPEGFDFTSAKPDTLSGEDTWRIASLKPGEKQTIVIKGLISGGEQDVRRFGATVGVPKDGSPNTLASQLATANAEITIDQPSLNLSAVINGSPSETVVVKSDARVRVELEYRNSLDTSLHDAEITVSLGGNAIDDYKVEVYGDYNDRRKEITFDYRDNGILEEIRPNGVARFEFTLVPQNITRRTPQVELEVKVEGKRREGSRDSDLAGSIKRIIKVEGAPLLNSQTNYTEGPFVNTGPIPPQVGKVTQYTYLLSAQAGVNELTGAEVTAILPSWVEWLDLVTTGDTVTYNATTRTMRWVIGDLKAREEVSVGIQVSVTPRGDQVGTSPSILETQRFRATDRFTGTTVRADAPALTTSLLGDSPSNGRVRD